MRVLQLIDSLSTGGAEKLQLTYVQQAVARGLQPTVMALRKNPLAVLPQQLEDAGARVMYLEGRGLTDLRRVLRLATFLREERIQILHTHLEYATILGAAAGALAGVPVVASVHNTRPDRWKELEALVLRHGVRVVIAVGMTVADAYRDRIGRTPLVIVANPVNLSPVVDVRDRDGLRAQLAGDARRALLVSAGRLTAQKGYFDLLAAVDLLRGKHPELMLVVAGIGSMEEQIRARIENCGLASHVRLLGLRSDVPQIMEVADLYLSASLWEGLPIAVLEAMAEGLPVVATAVGDVAEILKDGRGCLVPAAEPALLAEAAAQVLESPELARQLAASARQYVEAHHRPDLWFDELNKIYAGLGRDTRQGAQNG